MLDMRCLGNMIGMQITFSYNIHSIAHSCSYKSINSKYIKLKEDEIPNKINNNIHCICVFR